MTDRRLKAKMTRPIIWLVPLLCAAGLVAAMDSAFAAEPPPGAPLVAASDNMALNLANAPGLGRVTPTTPTQDPTPQELAQQQYAAQHQQGQGGKTGTVSATRTVTAPPQDNGGSGSSNAQPATATATVTTTTPGGPNSASVNETNAQTEALANALAAEAARAAQASANADAARAEAQQKMSDRAYNSAIRGLYPMSPDQIKGVMQKMEETQNAAVQPSYGQPKPQVAVQTVSLDPGAAPPEIDVAVGYVTTLTILDASGQPWPIIDIGVGGNFDIPTPDQNSAMIRITPLTRFGYGNLSVRLKDLATPITFRLSAGNDIVHYRYDARIPSMGPNAKTQLIQHTKLAAGDDMIMAVLDNSIPSGAKKLKVTGTDRRTAAYKIGDRTFVRTPLSMLSPSWDASVASADGMTVYETGDAPVILLSDAGQLVRVHLSEQAVQ